MQLPKVLEKYNDDNYPYKQKIHRYTLQKKSNENKEYKSIREERKSKQIKKLEDSVQKNISRNFFWIKEIWLITVKSFLQLKKI